MTLDLAAIASTSVIARGHSGRNGQTLTGTAAEGVPVTPRRAGGYPGKGMGRCYEFGVDVVASCGHAMVVSASGGQCECPTCGARCGGRFAACAGILARPGYTPAIAPPWAVQRTAPPVPVPLLSRPVRPSLRADAGSDTLAPLDPYVQIRDEAREIVDDAVGDAVQDLRTALHGATTGLRGRIEAAIDAAEADRDRGAGSGAADELATALQHLAEGLDGVADRQAAVEERLTEVLERLAAAPPPSGDHSLRAVASVGRTAAAPGVKRPPDPRSDPDRSTW